MTYSVFEIKIKDLKKKTLIFHKKNINRDHQTVKRYAWDPRGFFQIKAYQGKFLTNECVKFREQLR